MKQTSDDLRNEYRDLADLVRTLTPAQWRLRSDFYGWTPWDEIAHLCFFDETGLLSATDPDAFATDTALRYSDGSARDWLRIAQCFAGPPADAPGPGVRKAAASA